MVGPVPVAQAVEEAGALLPREGPSGLSSGLMTPDFPTLSESPRPPPAAGWVTGWKDLRGTARAPPDPAVVFCFWNVLETSDLTIQHTEALRILLSLWSVGTRRGTEGRSGPRETGRARRHGEQFTRGQTAGCIGVLLDFCSQETSPSPLHWQPFGHTEGSEGWCLLCPCPVLQEETVHMELLSAGLDLPGGGDARRPC